MNQEESLSASSGGGAETAPPHHRHPHPVDKKDNNMDDNEHHAENENENDDLSSLGDASPMDDGEAFYAQRVQKCRSNLQKFCSLSFVAIYVLVYLSLSSNPEVIVVDHSINKFDYQYAAQHNGAVVVGTSKNSVHNNLTSSSHRNHPTTLIVTQKRTGDPSEGDQHQQQEQQSQINTRDQYIQQTASSIARVYTPVSPNSWCIDARLKLEQAKRRPMGLCYLKIPRAASSTLVGINMRIARNFASRQGLQETCIRHDGPAPGFYYRQREPGLSYLWTLIRDPTDRAMSRVAANVAKRQMALPAPSTNHTTNHTNGTTTVEDDDETSKYVLRALKTSIDVQFGTISEGRGGFQVQYTMPRIIDEYTFWNASEPTKVRHPRGLQQEVQEILHRYDFMGTVDRLDESLVALQLLLGLETADLLYFSSRTPTQPTATKLQRRDSYVCQHNMDPRILRTPAVENYLSSAEWFAQNYGDLLLHRAASLSLDRTIGKIGHDEFSTALASFRSMLQTAHETCHPKSPCSKHNSNINGTADGDPTPARNNGDEQQEELEGDYYCYEGDIGCGFHCLDSFYQ